MIWRVLIARGASLGLVAGTSFIQWRITTPGVITFIEWRAMLWLGAVCLVVTLCASWVGDGRSPVDTRDEPRFIRPPWS